MYYTHTPVSVQCIQARLLGTQLLLLLDPLMENPTIIKTTECLPSHMACCSLHTILIFPTILIKFPYNFAIGVSFYLNTEQNPKNLETPSPDTTLDYWYTLDKGKRPASRIYSLL